MIAKIRKYGHLPILWLWVSSQFVNFVPTQNEENYFALAKQFFQPEWIPWSFHLTEFPGTRLLFQYIAGFFLQYLSFETVASYGRLLCFFLILWPLNKVFDKLGFNLAVKLCVLQIFILFDQTYFAGGWIFQGFEAKSLSFIFLFFSLNEILNKRIIAAFLLAAIASCFHILVGGWFTLALGIFVLMEKYPVKKIVIAGASWVIIVLPFAYYLAAEILAGTPSVIGDVNLDEIYVFLRNPHHTGIYRPWSRFMQLHFPGVLALAVSFVIGLLAKGKRIRPLRNLFLAFSGLVLLCFIVGIFDVSGAFLKYYPFRNSVTALLLFIILGFYWLQNNMVSRFYRVFWILIFFIVTLPSFYKGITHNYHLQERGVLTDEQEKLFTSCRELSNEGEVFLFLDYLEWDADISFIRKTRRERFFIFKFIPAGGGKVYDWYRRYLFKKEVMSDIHKLKGSTYDIDFVVSSLPLDHAPFLNLRHKSGKNYIYEFRNE